MFSITRLLSSAYLYYYQNHKFRWRKVVGGGRGRHTLRCEPATSRRWAVEVNVFTHAHVSIITYRVHVYQSRPIGAFLLTTSPQQGCLALKGLHTGLAGRGDGYPLNTYHRSNSWETRGLSSSLQTTAQHLTGAWRQRR